MSEVRAFVTITAVVIVWAMACAQLGAGIAEGLAWLGGIK
jgi:hypothetical protein